MRWFSFQQPPCIHQGHQPTHEVTASSPTTHFLQHPGNRCERSLSTYYVPGAKTPSALGTRSPSFFKTTSTRFMDEVRGGAGSGPKLHRKVGI